MSVLITAYTYLTHIVLVAAALTSSGQVLRLREFAYANLRDFVHAMHQKGRVQGVELFAKKMAPAFVAAHFGWRLHAVVPTCEARRNFVATWWLA